MSPPKLFLKNYLPLRSGILSIFAFLKNGFRLLRSEKMTAENRTVNFGLPADERIKSLKLFDQLFASGESHWQSPFRMLVVEIPYDEAFPVQVGVAVPKRKMKKAVLRNRQKRLMREAYRLQKTPLTAFCRTQKKGMAVLFVAQCNTPLTFAKTEEKIILLLRRLTKLNATPAE